MIKLAPPGGEAWPPAPSHYTPALPRAAANAVAIDAILLGSALFLQRFSLPYGNTFLLLDLVPVAFVLLYQFAAGHLFIQYDRLWWYLAVVAAATTALLFNFKTTMLTSYFLFIILYSFVTFARPSTAGLYKRTLRVFQILVAILSFLAVVQFIAQFALDGKKLIMFFGLVPDALLGYFYAGGVNTIHPLFAGSSILKSNGLFLAEPSGLSQITAIGILIEVLEFGRPLYLLIMALGFLTAYSGTGLMILAFLLFAGVRNERAILSVLFVIVCAVALFATGVVDQSVFAGRIGEFSDPHASGFLRFVAPFRLAAMQFDAAPLLTSLVGSGPGTSKLLNNTSWYSGGFTDTWFKLYIEYGIIGSMIFWCFLASCLRKSRCPPILLAALMVNFVFNVGFLTTSYLTLMVVLCTLSGPESKQLPAGGAGWRQPVLASRGASRSAATAM